MRGGKAMVEKIRVSILDDHQSIIDGYSFRLNKNPAIEIVASALYGEDLEPMLRDHPTDVLLLDIQVPTAKDNANPYPLLHLIPKLIQKYPGLKILAISMYNQPSLIQSVMEAGASGYILKDDQATIQELGNIVQAVAKDGIHLSQSAYEQLFKRLPKDATPTPRQLQALSLCAAYPDATTAELASRLGIADSTMRNLLSGAYLHLEVRNRTSAIAKARKLGLITPLESYP
jgi:DNA-binding NarL/FixJ family response regulator